MCSIDRNAHRGIDTAEYAELARKYAPRLADLPERRLVRSMAFEAGADSDFGTAKTSTITSIITSQLLLSSERHQKLAAMILVPVAAVKNLRSAAALSFKIAARP